MSKWFVYSGEEYYPYAKVIEADTPDQAAERYEYLQGEQRPILVFPWDAVALKIGWKDDDAT
jgi:hypothetical protein